MELRPIEESLVQTVAEWLAEKQNYQWLDFGYGNQLLTQSTIQIMGKREGHLLRVYTDDLGDKPIGIVAFSNISRSFKTANIWYLLGDKRYAGLGCTKRAVSRMLAFGFGELGLNAINAWAVEANRPSLRILLASNFQMLGRQRRCHYIDGLPHDRLHFDLLRSEFKGVLP
jgi:RimJ/RimL family protein N-acetyltransferase